MANILMSHAFRLITLATLTLAVPQIINGQKQTSYQNEPIVTGSKPSVVAPGMSIDVASLHPDGLPENHARVRIIFLQDGKSYEGTSGGGTGIYPRSLISYLTVPTELKPGACQIVVQVDKKASLPFAIEISASVLPPVITSEHPEIGPYGIERPARPEDSVSVKGANFSPSDKIELIDSSGKVYQLTNHSYAESAGFTVPEDIAEGEATFQIIEQRSGTEQRSKKVPFQILNKPLPLEVRQDELKPVAPGQWMILFRDDAPPYKKKHVEVGFVQNRKMEIVALQVDVNDDMYIRVPETLLPGEVYIQTRVLIDGKISDWSEPARYELLSQPAPPSVSDVRPIYKLEPHFGHPAIYIEADKQQLLVLERGDRISISGQFTVESPLTLRVRLTNGKESFVLEPNKNGAIYKTYFEVVIPEKLSPGDWQIFIYENGRTATTKLPLTLYIQN